MTKRADKWLKVKSDVTPFFCHAFKLWEEIDPQVVKEQILGPAIEMTRVLLSSGRFYFRCYSRSCQLPNECSKPKLSY